METGKIDMETALGRMINYRIQLVWGSSIKIIILYKKDYFSKKKWHGTYQSGDRVGTKPHDKEKGITVFLRNPLIYLVGRVGIEPTTY